MSSIALPYADHGDSPLLSQTTEWGLSVSEATSQMTFARKCLLVIGYVAFVAASIWVIPVLVGTAFFSASPAVWMDVGIVAACVTLAYGFNTLSRRGPKNALQIDFAAEEVRLGSINSAGAFVRHTVCGFRSIDDVIVDTADKDAPGIRLKMGGKDAALSFAGASADQTADLAGKISNAVQAAKAAPMRSRIRSQMHGFEAGIGEVGSRVRSRVRSSFA